jgi:hypothetical protein
MTTRTSVLRSALPLVSARLVATQIGLAVLVFALSVLWLRVPDASLVDVVGTVLLGIFVLALAGGGEASLMLRLCGRPLTPWRLLRGGVLVLLGVGLWLGWSLLIGHLSANDWEWAGYLNSRAPHQWRNVFSYFHIHSFFEVAWSTLRWLGAGVLGALVFAATAAARPLRALRTIFRSLSYWLCLLAGVIATVQVTGFVMSWTPGHGLAVETFSLVLRLAGVVIFDALVVCLLLSVLAACVLRSDSFETGGYETPAGTPEDSQPRTEPTP